MVPKIISKNQFGFVEGRNIAKKILLDQEIIRDIGKRNTHHNAVVNLDMAKAYDRVFWVFLTKVLKKFGFYKVLIDLV